MTASRWTVAVLVSMLAVTSLWASPVASGGAQVALSPGASATVGAIVPGGHASTPSNPASLRPSGSAALTERILALARSDGVPRKDMFLPDFNAHPQLRDGVVQPVTTTAPAPMGIGDIGVRNTSDTSVPYVLQSTSWEGTLSLGRIDPFLINNDGPDTFTVQLNTVTSNTTVGDNTSGAYWIQNVFDYTPSAQSLTFLDNIWNFSSPSTSEPASTFYSYNGTPAAPVFYYDVGPTLSVAMPFSVQLYVNTSTTVNASSGIGYPTVRFGFDVINASGARQAQGVYDTVLFTSTLPAAQVPLTRFMVNGGSLTPTGFLLYDSELMIGGPGGGTSTSIYGLNGSEGLRFLNGTTHLYQNAPSAWNLGMDTGETSEGIAEAYTVPGTVELSAGPSIPMPLWNSTPGGNAGLAEIVGAGHAVQRLRVPERRELVRLFRRGLGPDPPGAVRARCGPSGVSRFPADLRGRDLPVRAAPGNYTIECLLSEYDNANATLDAAIGQNPVNFTLPSDPSVGVDTPLVAWGNYQLSGISRGGNGSASDPYLLDNNQYAPLDPLFGELNDFGFAVFSGIILANTNASVRIDQAPSFDIDYLAIEDSGLLNAGLPTSNDLQIEVYNASHVTIWDASAISGWFASSGGGPDGGLPLANVVFWDVSDSLIAGSTFLSQGSSLLLMNGAGTGGGNEVWGNTFDQGTVTPGMLYGGMGVGIWAFEAGDLIYNNYVGTADPAVAFDENLWGGFFQYNLENWNLPGVELATDQAVVNGVTLSGSIIGSPWQCGNDWGASALGSPVPYTDFGAIQSGGDSCPYPITLATYPVTFTESGLASGTWSVTIQGDRQSAVAGGQIGFQLPVGSWEYEVATDPATAAAPSTGNVSVAGRAVVVPVNLSSRNPLFAVTFVERGLSLGSWSVLLGNETGDAFAGSPVVFEVPAGQYTYAPVPEPGYAASPSEATFSFSSANPPSTFTIAFVPAPTPFEVTFTEGGLSLGTAWSVTLAGVTEGSFGATIAFGEPNGSYSYSVGPVADYTPFGMQGSVAVAGMAVFVAIPFTPVNGVLSGTIDVPNATLTVNGVTVPAPNGSFLEALPPGTYTVLVLAPGYAPYSDTVSVSPGSTTHLAITLTSVAAPTASLSGAQYDGLLAVLVFLGIAILVAGVLVARGRSRSAP